jgi:hypothetical protein
MTTKNSTPKRKKKIGLSVFQKIKSRLGQALVFAFGMAWFTWVIFLWFVAANSGFSNLPEYFLELRIAFTVLVFVLTFLFIAVAG